jgi:Domain of unknown function (DUF4389)
MDGKDVAPEGIARGQPDLRADRADAAGGEEVPALVVRLEHRRLRFLNRIGVYVALMDDKYPSTDERQAVHLDFPYPDGEQLSRGLPLVKWLLAIPHYIVLFFLYIGVFFSVIAAWIAILFTGRHPKGIFDFVEARSAGTTASSATPSPSSPTTTRPSGLERE